MNNFDNVAKNTLDEWINFLKNEEVKMGTKAKGLQAAKDSLEILKLSKEDMLEYERDEAVWRDYASGMSTNFLAGKLEGIREMAINAMHMGMQITEIVKLTGLPEEDIKSIRF